jgi:hypothetical protein
LPVGGRIPWPGGAGSSPPNRGRMAGVKPAPPAESLGE